MFFHSNHLRAIKINSTLNILIHFFGYAFIPISVNYMPRTGILRTSCRCMLNPVQQWQLSKGLYQLVIYSHHEFILLYILTNSKLIRTSLTIGEVDDISNVYLLSLFAWFFLLWSACSSVLSNFSSGYLFVINSIEIDSDGRRR